MNTNKTLLTHPPCLHPNLDCHCKYQDLHKDTFGCQLIKVGTDNDILDMKGLDELIDKLIFLHIHRKEQAKTLALLNIKHSSKVIQHIVKFILNMDYCQGPVKKYKIYHPNKVIYKIFFNQK